MPTKPGTRPAAIFKKLIESDPQVQAKLTPAEINECFNPDYQMRNIDKVYQRLDI